MRRYLKLFTAVFAFFRILSSLSKSDFSSHNTAYTSRIPEIDQSSLKPSLINKVSVILLSGGVGKRFGAPIPKQYMDLVGLPVALHAFARLTLHPYCKEVIVVCEPEFDRLFADFYATLSVGDVRPALLFARPSREYRHESMASGIRFVTGNFVAVHDAARPLVDGRAFARVCEDAEAFGAAVLANPVKATLKRQAAMLVESTVDRANLWEAQTPQVFRTSLLLEGLGRFNGGGKAPTDDASLVELFAKVKITPGHSGNVKITTPDDLVVAEALLRVLL